tara:strand:+ start:1818 stop:2936 length:1119 start_codon:yes stop_codon:yes gene_type:complete
MISKALPKGIRLRDEKTLQINQSKIHNGKISRQFATVKLDLPDNYSSQEYEQEFYKALQEAVNIKANLKTKVSLGNDDKYNKQTLSEIFSQLNMTRFSKLTSQDAQEIYYKDLLKFFGNIKINQIRFEQVEDFKIACASYIKDRSNVGTSHNSSVNKRLGLLRVMFEYACDRRLIDGHNIPTIRNLPVSESKPKPVLYLDQQADLVQACLTNNDQDFADFINWAIEGGQRHSEIFALTLNNVTQKNNNYWLRFYRTKTGVWTEIQLTHCMIEIFERKKLSASQRQDQKLFLYNKNTIRHKWDFYRKQANLSADYVPYTTRHTTATRLVEANLDIKSVQYYLGHKDIKTTLTYYAKPTDSMKSKIADTINNIN